jgi:hypothetical protein
MQEIVRIAPVQGEPGLIAYPDASHLLGRGMLCSHLHDSNGGQNKEGEASLFLLDLEIYRGLLTAVALNLILNGLPFVERH